MQSFKPGLTVLGVDDAPYSPDSDETALIGTVFRAGDTFEGVLSRRIMVDGSDVTAAIASMATEPPHSHNIQAVLCDGLTFAGFNVLAIDELYEKVALPVIAVTSRRPDFHSIEQALHRFDDGEDRFALMQEAGTPERIETDKGVLYVQYRGCGSDEVAEILRYTASTAVIPEPIRAAHMIGAGIREAFPS